MAFAIGDKVRVDGYDDLGNGELVDIVAGGARRKTAYVRFDDNDERLHEFSASALRAPRTKAPKRKKKFILPTTRTPIFEMKADDENVHPAVRHYLAGHDELQRQARHPLMIASVDAEETGRGSNHREAALEWSQYLLTLPLVVSDKSGFGWLTGRVKANPDAQRVREIIDHHLTEARDAETRLAVKKANKVPDAVIVPDGAVPLPMTGDEDTASHRAVEEPKKISADPKSWPKSFR